MLTDFRMEAVSKIERQGTVREINDIAFWSIDKDFVGKEVKAELFDVNFFASAEPGGGLLELSNPEEVSRKVLDFAGFVVFGQFLLVVIEAGGKTAFGVFVHLVSTNLEFDDAFILGDNGGVKRLVTVLLWHGNIIFDTATHRHIEGMNDAKGKIAIGNVVNDNTKGGKVINFTHVLIVFDEFFVQGIHRFDATRNLEFNLFATKGFGNLFLDFLHGFLGGDIVFFDNVSELTVALGIDIRERDISHLNAETTHVETVG